MNELFLDAGYLIALEASDDQYHSDAVEYWIDFRPAPVPLITTTFVFDEVVTFFNNRKNHSKAVELGNKLLQSEFVELIGVDEGLFARGWDYFQNHTDKRYSLTDCISFVVIQDRTINSALTFDKHFTQAGFKKIP